jgi:hypothetical protein
MFVVEQSTVLGKAISDTDAIKVLVESLVNYGELGVKYIFQIDKVSIVDTARPGLVGPCYPFHIDPFTDELYLLEWDSCDVSSQEALLYRRLNRLIVYTI